MLDKDQIVIATNEELQLRQVLIAGGTRYMVLRRLTREQYDAMRAENARIRDAHGRSRKDLVRQYVGEKPALMHPTSHQPTDPPQNLNWYWEARRV
jgi:hypothetical protein